MLVDGRMVNPVEWWDPHWISDPRHAENQGMIDFSLSGEINACKEFGL
jgi:hypothetical protein